MFLEVIESKRRIFSLFARADPSAFMSLNSCSSLFKRMSHFLVIEMTAVD
jgi:hypothetical protein